MAKKPHARKIQKAQTKQKVLDGARAAFTGMDYHEATIREIARGIGLSTGSIYSNFEAKEDLFLAAMGVPAPVDGPITRAAPMLLASLKACVDGLARNSPAWIDAQWAIELAETPLDGDAWARHLETVRRAEPHAPAEQPAASAPSSDAAGAQ